MLASERTCQTKGRFLKFIRANRRANILHTPPGAFTPVHLASTLRYEGWLTSAAIAAPTAATLTTRDMVTLKLINKIRSQNMKGDNTP